MKKKVKAFAALAITLCMIFAAASPAYADDEEADTVLKFNDNGKFTILQFADCQDNAFPSKIMLKLIEKACEEIKPDLVIFTGDNTVQKIGFLNRKAIEKLIAPVASLGIPYAYIFGNHDSERGVAKDVQHNTYMQNGTCLTYNADDSLHGFGNCNLPVLSSDGSDIAFNLWLIDSNMYHEDDGYDIVHDDQIEWYKKTSIALEEQAGHKVNSLVFQHMIVPEIFDYLEPAPRNAEGKIDTEEKTKNHIGRDETYILKFKESASLNKGAVLGEFPCPPSYNTNEFTVMAERGDVIGMVFSHDHVNSFVLNTPEGIDLIQTAGMSFRSYGDDSVRGFRVITLDENDTSTYETETYTYFDFFTQEEIKADKGFFISLWGGLLNFLKKTFCS